MTNSDLQLRTNNAPRVVIQATTGRVGIGNTAPISDLHIRKDASGKLGPIFTLMNGGGAAGAAAAIDLSGYDPGASAPAFRVQAIDDGAFSARLAFSAKKPGANANPLVEHLSINSDGSVTARNSLSCGSIAFPPANGRIAATGPVAEFSFMKRQLSSWPAQPALGDRYVWYNDGGIARLWTEVRGDLLTVDSAANLVVGGGASKPGGGMWTALSDKRLKKNINPLGDVLDKLLSLRGVTFEWKEPEKFGNLVGTQVGLIAQEVEQVFPDWVGVDSEGFKTVTVRGLEAIAIEAFREIKQEINALKEAVAGIQAKLRVDSNEQKPAERPAKSATRKSDGGQKK